MTTPSSVDRRLEWKEVNNSTEHAIYDAGRLPNIMFVIFCVYTNPQESVYDCIMFKECLVIRCDVYHRSQGAAKAWCEAKLKDYLDRSIDVTPA